MQFIFWVSVGLIFYAYFGYLIFLLFIYGYQIVLKNKVNKSKAISTKGVPPSSTVTKPPVSFIITAYNEEARIAKKIENSLELSYHPADQLEIIVASDCSNDTTDQIVQSYAERGVKLVRSPERKGKEHAQMHAVRAAAGTILVFSDVATILKADAIERIVKNFDDPSVGCVSSEDRFIDRNGLVSGEGLYVKYEMFIRKLESRVNTLVGLSGSFFAARREVCHNWAPDLQSDFNTVLNSVKAGFKGITDPDCIGYYEDIADESKEFNRKVRTVLRGITVLMRNKHLLDFRKYGMFSWQLLSHKICRWLVPFFLISSVFSNLIIFSKSYIYVLSFLMQSAIYGAAIFHKIKLLRKKERDDSELDVMQKQQHIFVRQLKKILAQTARISYYFISVNLSILVAWIKYLKGERATYWNPSKRHI